MFRLFISPTSALCPTRVVSPTWHLQKPIHYPTVHVLLWPGICRKPNPCSDHARFASTWHLQNPIRSPTTDRVSKWSLRVSKWSPRGSKWSWQVLE